MMMVVVVMKMMAITDSAWQQTQSHVRSTAERWFPGADVYLFFYLSVETVTSAGADSSVLLWRDLI